MLLARDVLAWAATEKSNKMNLHCRSPGFMSSDSKIGGVILAFTSTTQINSSSFSSFSFSKFQCVIETCDPSVYLLLNPSIKSEMPLKRSLILALVFCVTCKQPFFTLLPLTALRCLVSVSKKQFLHISDALTEGESSRLCFYLIPENRKSAV